MIDFESLRRICVTTLFLSILVVGCGSDDDPAGPGNGGTGAIEISTERVDFGTRFGGASYTSTFEVEATGSNAFEGTIAVADGAAFAITDGGGEVRIEPGATHEVDVRWNAPSAGNVSTGAISVGSRSVELRGFASAFPYFVVTPTGLSEVDIRTNDRRFDDGGIGVDYGTGRTNGASPSWLSCRSGGKWTFNGQGVAESKVAFTFPGTSSVEGVEVKVSMEVEGDCTQVLIEVDGDENAYEDLEGCSEFTRTYQVGGGGHTIGIGTDQQGLCGDDLYVDWIRITVTGALVTEANYNR